MSTITTFTTVGMHTFTVPQDSNYDILLVGGGGGGGGAYLGGGGGGDVIEKLNYRLNAGTYTVTVGDGGNGGYETLNPNSASLYIRGENGGTSSITSNIIGFEDVLYAAGGAGSGTNTIHDPQATPTIVRNNIIISSGGGAVGKSSGTIGGSGNSISGNGDKGGGRGGGAAPPSTGNGKNGGFGITSSISGVSTSYGGGGIVNYGGGDGAIDGGGAGGTLPYFKGGNGFTNRGGGGYNITGSGGKGGSGIVIIKLNHPINCVWVPNEWSTCSSTATCDGINPTRSGTKTRTFSKTSEAENGGTCSEQPFNSESCILPCPRDCSGNYSEWTDASNNPVCPSTTNYSILDNSFNIIKNRTRRFDISYNALNGGLCPQIDISSNTSGTYDFKCPRDCLGGPITSDTSYTEWSNWLNPCPNTNDYNAPDTSFNNITQNRTRTYIKTKNQLNEGSCYQEDDIYYYFYKNNNILYY